MYVCGVLCMCYIDVSVDLCGTKPTTTRDTDRKKKKKETPLAIARVCNAYYIMYYKDRLIYSLFMYTSLGGSQARRIMRGRGRCDSGGGVQDELRSPRTVCDTHGPFLKEKERKKRFGFTVVRCV